MAAQHEKLTFKYTGPWPPYNFVNIRLKLEAGMRHVFILDSLLIDGLGFVFDKIRVAAEAEQDDDSRLREALLDGQTRLESGELSEDEYAALERDVLERLGAIRRRRQGGATAIDSRVTGVDVEVHRRRRRPAVMRPAPQATPGYGR